MAVLPAKIRKSLLKRRDPFLALRIAFGDCHQDAYAGLAAGLLRTRRHGQDRSRSQQRDELPPPHSITSSARSRNASDTASPIALAVFRLITISNLVGCITGRSVVFAPFSTLAA